ncbi:MAG TPA: NAD-dependent epimerase/dehydratase family protein, partial [Blastocatellia bacterium]|nr:NAD-dependent epimerase/dehydratase family protein [Blastocatellia bacterium]
MPENRGTALVTGATGFVGSHLVEHLIEKGYRVRCLVRQNSNLKYLNQDAVQFAQGGLDGRTDWDQALTGVDSVYHVAGLTFARRAADYFSVNHKGTETILAESLKRRDRVKKFVYISSLAAVGPSPDGRPVEESAEPKPITPYGRSKLLAEQAVIAVRDLLNVTIVRPPAVYGPRDYAIYEFFKSISRGVAPAIGSGDMKISLVHVRDLVEGILLAGESRRSSGRTYFISSEMIYSVSSVNQALMEIIGRKARSIAVPRPVAYIAAILAEGVAALTRRPPVINRDKVKDFSQKYWTCSVEAAKRDLGYKQRTPLEIGLQSTYEWYKK